MVTLQTLRNKGGVILAVVIGIALLAFLLGDMLTSGSMLFGSANKIGKIEGKSINYQDYALKVDYYEAVNEALLGGTSSQDINERNANQAWEEFIRNGVFQPQFNKLGLNVSEEESIDLLSPENPSPVIAQYFSDPSTGTYNQEYYRYFRQTMDYDSTDTRLSLLSFFQSESDFVSSMTKMTSIIRGGYYPTDYEVDRQISLMKKHRNIRFVYKELKSVSDSVAELTQEDIKKCYDQRKNYFETTDSRTINYVTFDVIPSKSDYVLAQKFVDGLAEGLAKAENPVLYAQANSTDKGLTKYYAADDLDSEIASYAFSKTDGIYGPVLNGDVYTIARVVEVKNIPDSIDVSQIALQGTKTQLADSIMTVLNSGKGNFTELAMQFSEDATNAKDGGKLGKVDPTMLPDEFSQQLISAKPGQFFKVENSNAIFIIKVNSVESVRPKALIAYMTYQVEPSNETRNVIYNKANRFASMVSGSVEKFTSVARDSMLQIQVAKFGPADVEIEGVKDSREAITWAYNKGDEQKTSDVKTFGDTFFVAALIKSTEKGVAPLDDVYDDIAYAARLDKKAEYVKNQFAGEKSLEAIAEKYNLKIVEANDVSFNSFTFPEIGFNSGLAGGIATLPVGKLSKPIITPTAVIVAEVISENDSAQEVDSGLIKETFKTENAQSAFQQAYKAIYYKAEIVDQRYKLYR